MTSHNGLGLLTVIPGITQHDESRQSLDLLCRALRAEHMIRAYVYFLPGSSRLKHFPNNHARQYCGKKPWYWLISGIFFSSLESFGFVWRGKTLRLPRHMEMTWRAFYIRSPSAGIVGLKSNLITSVHLTCHLP